MNAEPQPGRRPWLLPLAAATILAGLALGAWLWRQHPGSAGPLAERLAITYDARLDLTSADRVWTLGDLEVGATMSRPARPLTPIDFRIWIRQGGRPVAGLHPELAFNMDMDMGRLAIALREDPDGYRGRVVLPACLRGGKRWYARLRLEHDAGPIEQTFLFDLR